MTVSLETLIDRSTKNMGSGIHSVVKESAIELIKRAYKEKIYVQITSGFRGMEEQAKLYGKGRSNYIYNGKQYASPSADIVTNAKPGESNHNFGLAIDYVLVSDDGKIAIWTVNDKWKRVAAIGKDLGFKWGGDWTSFKDYPHLEMMGGLSLADLRNGKKPNLVSKVSKSTATPANVTAPSPSTKKESVKYPGMLFKVQSPMQHNDYVKKIQQQLNKKAGKTVVKVDSYYGNDTKKAVMDYQKKNKLSADGVVGKDTWNSLFKY